MKLDPKTVKALVEGVKELARVGFLAAVGFGILWAQNKLGGFDPTTIQYIVGTALLRAVDKFVHKSDALPLDGLSPI